MGLLLFWSAGGASGRVNTRGVRPPLALSAVAIDAEGRETTWWSGDRYAHNRPQGVTFSTRIGEGFADAGLTLARKVTEDNPDMGLYDTVVLVGDDGQIAYEGRIGSTPRSSADGGRVTVQTAGWMAHARDQKFVEVYVDREASAWGEEPFNRKVSLMTTGTPKDLGSFRWSVDGPALVCALPNQALPAQAIAETWYTAPEGVTIASVQYIGSDTSLPGSWESPSLREGANDSSDTANTAATFDGTLRSLTLTTPRQFLFWRHFANGTAATPAAGANRRLSAIATYGNHGLTTRDIDSSTPDGLYASDVMENILARFCPKLRWGGQDTTLVIPHIAFKERTHPYDALLQLNGPHNHMLAVYENRTLLFQPYDLSEADWVVRTDQPGVETQYEGPTSDGLANYCVVEFDNAATGRRDSVSPSDSSDLEDTSVDHPANRHGLNVELTIGLSVPTTEEVAIQFGRSYLAEYNRPKKRGQIRVQGHIQDAAGHWRQAWCPRYGDTISIADHPSDEPRLITETSYSHDDRTVTISTDNGELNLMEAVIDYLQTNLRASGLI